ncbi:membrane hypothetical protein [Gammaproteobacteria bacterium]
MNFSGRKFMVVASIVTLCAVLMSLVIGVILNPKLYPEIKELILLVVGGFLSLVGLIGSKYFERTDRPAAEPEQPKAPGGFVSLKMLLGLLLVSALLWLAIPAPAVDVPADNTIAFRVWGDWVVYRPAATVKAISLYDFWNGVGLVGAETPITGIRQLSLNFGAITSFIGNGMPFISLDRGLADISPNILRFLNADSDMRFGIWYGYDFELKDSRAGVKASVKLW